MFWIRQRGARFDSHPTVETALSYVCPMVLDVGAKLGDVDWTGGARKCAMVWHVPVHEFEHAAEHSCWALGVLQPVFWGFLSTSRARDPLPFRCWPREPPLFGSPTSPHAARGFGWEELKEVVVAAKEPSRMVFRAKARELVVQEANASAGFELFPT